MKKKDRLIEAGQLNPNDDESVFRGRVLRSLEEIPKNEKELIPELIDSFNSAQKHQADISPVYLPSKDWKTLFEEEWQSIYEDLSSQNRESVAAFLRNFFRNEGISGLWGNTSVFESFCRSNGSTAYRRDIRMLDQYEAWREMFPNTSLSELDAPKIGNPWGYDFDGIVLIEPVFEYHAQAEYLRNILSEIPTPVVLEIGGGFGGLAYYLLRGGRSLKYIGLDLPENVLIQSYFLKVAFPQAKILMYSNSFTRLDQETLREYDIILLPNFIMPDIASSLLDLIVNVRSLSEMQSETIEEYMHQIDRIGRLFFFHENLSEERKDGLHGILSKDFPILTNFTRIAQSESRWPKYKRTSSYPCQEFLFLHKQVVRTYMSKLPVMKAG